MTTCPRCGTQLSADRTVCPTCGAAVDPQSSAQSAGHQTATNPWQSGPTDAPQGPPAQAGSDGAQNDDTRIQQAGATGPTGPSADQRQERNAAAPVFPEPQQAGDDAGSGSGQAAGQTAPTGPGGDGRNTPYPTQLSEPRPTSDWIRVTDAEASRPDPTPSHPSGFDASRSATTQRGATPSGATPPGATPPGRPPTGSSRPPEGFPGSLGFPGPGRSPDHDPRGPGGIEPALDPVSAGGVRTGPSAAEPLRADPRPFARPAAYPSYLSWLVTAAGRNKLGLLGALIATWYGLPTGVLLGGVGLVIGGVGGFIGGTAGPLAGIDQVPIIGPMINQTPFVGTFLNEVAARGGGIVGLLVGAALGALAGFLIGLIGPWVLGFSAGWPTGLAILLAQIPIAALCSVLYTTYSIAAERVNFRIRGMRRPSRRERALFQPLLIDCARRLGLTDLPVLLIDDTRETNMYAGSRHLIITRGFMDEFNYDPEPIAGVFCHELTHWRNADCVSNYLVRGVALPLYLLYAAITRVMWLARRSYGVWAGILTFVLIITLWPIQVCVRLVIMPSQRNGSRMMEYQADQGAVAAGMRAGLRRALARFRASFDGARNGWEASVGSTHPPNELRLERIEDDGVDYPLPDPDGPAVPMQVAVTSVLERD
ncbi:M48 family metalloprotease [Microlunatus soli]|uniref:Zn-dependent protease with chaperone function n=1 Tax=Microlunatus soli TaxID=630515 RepID=A0A1H1T1J4_9ACTN|nr:M48 family metalloprotease [Microlunatus soli]SDS53836.1 Zn-dependent protease with chaperone function [Microlunatus soli]